MSQRVGNRIFHGLPVGEKHRDPACPIHQNDLMERVAFKDDEITSLWVDLRMIISHEKDGKKFFKHPPKYPSE